MSWPAVVLAAATVQGMPAVPPLPRQSARTQAYEIRADLSDDLKRLVGTARIELRNVAPVPIPDLELHLYWNGFRNTASTWLREQGSGAGRPGRSTRDDDFYGAIDVTSLRLLSLGDASASKLSSPLELAGDLRFVAPDDGNAEDRTVARVALPQAIPPGGRALLEVAFDSVVPRVVARTGRKDDFVLMAHWFPKLGVFEPAASGEWRWNTHQFHAGTEFFGEYASYDVRLAVPSRFEGKVGATGSLREGPTAADGGKVAYRFVQDDVHEFAWTADSRFVVETRRFSATDAENDPVYSAQKEVVRAATGLPDSELALSDVDVTLLLQPEHVHQADRMFRAASEGLRWNGLWFGRYPYSTLTIVDPRYGSNAGGMEYPTLFTAGSHRNASPREFTPEGVTVHEFTHQFWYGLVGSNEFEHAWMDEGLTTYTTGRILALAYGEEQTATRIAGVTFEGRNPLPFPTPRTSLERDFSLRALARPVPRDVWGLEIVPDDEPALRLHREVPFLTWAPVARPPIEDTRAGYLRGATTADRMDRESFRLRDGGSLRTNAYYKPATLLHSLERILGPERWARFMRTYHARFRFAHPRPGDFLGLLVQHAPDELVEPLRRFLEQTFAGSGTLDYAVLSATTREVAPFAGWTAQGGQRRLVSIKGGADEPSAKKEFDSEIVVARNGDVVFPVEIEWKREGEEPMRETWDGEYRWWRKRFPTGPKLEWVFVDPRRKLLIDTDLSNNERRLEGDGRAAVRWTLRALLSAETQLHALGSLR